MSLFHPADAGLTRSGCCQSVVTHLQSVLAIRPAQSSYHNAKLLVNARPFILHVVFSRCSPGFSRCSSAVLLRCSPTLSSCAVLLRCPPALSSCAVLLRCPPALSSCAVLLHERSAQFDIFRQPGSFAYETTGSQAVDPPAYEKAGLMACPSWSDICITYCS
jgi:hypothetical protein